MSVGGRPSYNDSPDGRRAARLPPYLQPRPYEPGNAERGGTIEPVTGAFGVASTKRNPAGPAPPGFHPTVFPAGPRPFVLTRGRVGDDVSEIGPETQVTTTSRSIHAERYGTLAALGPELRSIIALCARPISVAEISARLRLHLGVTKVLVSDLHAEGHVVVHVADTSSSNSTDIILRVMHGLRAIS